MKVTMNKINESTGDEYWDRIIQLCQSKGRDVIIDQDNMRVLVWDQETKKCLDWDTEIEDVAAENNETLEDVLINDSLWNIYAGHFGLLYEIPSTWNYLLRSKDSGNDADGIITSPNCILFYLPDIKSGKYLKDDYVSPYAQKEEVSESNGDRFKEFSVKWNELEKTKKCAPIHGNFSESSNDELKKKAKVDEIMRMIDRYADMYFDGFTGEKNMDMELRRLHLDIHEKIEELAMS